MISAFILLFLTLSDEIYEPIPEIDGTIEMAIIISVSCLLLIGLYLAYKGNRILKQNEYSDLPRGFYRNIIKKEYCPNCGYHLRVKAKYCEYCGTKNLSNDVMICSPNELSNEDIEACISLIRKGGAISPGFVPELTRAMVLAIIRDGQDIVGVGAIKGKWPEYASLIAQRSGFRFNKNTYELGYIAVKESHRFQGISYEIVINLLASFRDRPLFATTANEYMKRTLEMAGFVRQGHEWKGFNGELSLWIKYADSKKKPATKIYHNLRIRQ